MLSACPCELSLQSSGIDWRHSLPDHRLKRSSFIFRPHKHRPKTNSVHCTFLLSRNRGIHHRFGVGLGRSIHRKGPVGCRGSTPLSGLDDGFSGSYAKSDAELDETRSKLNASLQLCDSEINYVQALHEAARKFQLAMEQEGSLRKQGWLGKSWLGVDQFSWIKPLAYQAAVHALLQAVREIASRGEGRDRDTHILIQRSISRQLVPLEESINQQFLTRRANAEKWFWSQQHPNAVASFVEMLESDTRFTTVTAVGWEGASITPSKATDASLVSLTISNVAAIVKLGAAKLSCGEFFSTLNEEIGRLMSMLSEFIPIDQVYSITSGVGLRDQFLHYFGIQAAQYRNNDEIGGEEGAFWVDLVQQLLRGSISRERIRTKLTSYDSIEVLERDLAVFGFFAALGRKSQSFLLACTVRDIDEHIAGLLRYFIGGSTLFYPQLSSLNTYQLFIEVVSEEMDWLPFYPSLPPLSDHHHSESAEKPQFTKEEAISMVLDNCTRWINDFIKFGTWVQQPAGVRAANFLLVSQSRLNECIEAYPSASQQMAASKNLEDAELSGPSVKVSPQSSSYAQRGNRWAFDDADGMKRGLDSLQRKQLELFDKELQGVDEALSRLECLLLKPEMGPGKQHLTAACTNLEKIRQLKTEVETLEASLREKASAMLQVPENLSVRPQRRQKVNRERGYSRSEEDIDRQQGRNRTNVEAEGISKLFPFFQSRNSGTETSLIGSNSEDEGFDQTAALALQEASTVSKEIQRFELLREELMDLEKRIQECTGEYQEAVCETDISGTPSESIARKMEPNGEEQAKGNMLSNSLQKIKETSTDVWRGTQLLTTDVAAAVVLLKRSASGEELTERERKMLKRTLTDLASIVPIGFLMLLPVTAVGHAAILAAIQRYAPALIPSAYARERLDLMRQLEQVKENESAEIGQVPALLTTKRSGPETE